MASSLPPNIYKASTNGSLNPIDNCYLIIPDAYGGSRRKIVMNNLPDITDSKSAVYNNENIIGRSFPFYTFSHSADRQISMQMHFFVIDKDDAELNLEHLNWIRSAVYPSKSSMGLPFEPPPICKLKCGELLTSGNDEICVVLQSYTVKFPTDVAWDTGNFVPFRFDVDTSWLVVYTSKDLPYQSDAINGHRIITSQR